MFLFFKFVVACQMIYQSTRLTLACRTISLELIQHKKSEQGALMMRERGMKLCADLVEPTRIMEDLLVKTSA